MSTSSTEIVRRSIRGQRCEWRADSGETWWSQRREASLNWLALGLLLAAWNASDNDTAIQARRRPEALRGYCNVSVRAATLHSEELHAGPMNP